MRAGDGWGRWMRQAWSVALVVAATAAVGSPASRARAHGYEGAAAVIVGTIVLGEIVLIGGGIATGLVLTSDLTDGDAEGPGVLATLGGLAFGLGNTLVGVAWFAAAGDEAWPWLLGAVHLGVGLWDLAAFGWVLFGPDPKPAASRSTEAVRWTVGATWLPDERGGAPGVALRGWF
ncbi:MAG: hypothetical protein NZ898_03400 [Myxococcota bacterium]|nr:hypothetical protein [Myxococcota bacterium]MDW8361730.1 hypothetical protein [Myxococcales bacterium]